MTVIELKEKVKKAEEAVAKVEKTIERHTAQMEKKLKIVLDHGWDPENRWCRQDTPEHHEAYWAICEYDSKVEDIKNAHDKLIEKERILQNWKDRLEAAEAKENKFLTEVPECMKIMMEELITRWDESDLEKMEFLKSKYRELGYKDFIKEYKYSNYKFMMYETAETIHKANTRAAEGLIMDLYSRINAITGEVTEWGYIHYSGGALNGEVHGKLGSVRVESILAGGYNIQRLHVRVLVHEIKK